MPSIIPGYEYDIHLRLSYSGQVFISYRQKDNKYDGWGTKFVENLKKDQTSALKSSQNEKIFSLMRFCYHFSVRL